MLIKNGSIVLTDAVFQGDVRIENGVFSELGVALEGKSNEKIIDASGLLVLAGGIDSHTHFDLDTGTARSADDFYSGTRAAVVGGTTTILDFATQDKGRSLHDAYQHWRQLADDKSFCDYGFHMAIVDWNEQIKKEMGSLAQVGISSFKLYMAYKGALQVDDGVIYEALEESARIGGVIGFHCENGDLIAARIAENRRLNHCAASYHSRTRPEAVEEEAISRLLAIGGLAKAPVWIVHLSTGGGLDLALEARAKGQKVLLETCPQYLLLDDSCYGNEGDEDFSIAKYVISPPLRSLDSQRRLWNGVISGEIDFLSTDHCSFNFKGQKELGREDYSLIPNGAPGVEHRFSLLYTYGVKEGRISLPQFTRLVSQKPAEAFGLHNKGSITPGKDADFVLYNPNGEWTISAANQTQRVDYTPFEGMKIKGRIERVFLRGQEVVKQGKILVNEAVGQYQKRGQSKV